jgi:lysyl endopeptidase
MTNLLKIAYGRTLVITGLISWLFVLDFSPLQAQRSYGGRPLSMEEEVAYVRALADYLVELPSFDVDSLLREDSIYHNPNGALRFAHKMFVNLSPENSGIIFNLEDGTKIWKLGLRSKGAYSLNVIFEEYIVPPGARLYLYNPDKTQVLGSFTSDNMQESGEFAIAPVSGEEIMIEYHEPADAAFPGRLRLTEVNHDYRGPMLLGTKFDKLNLPCVPELSCQAEYDSIGRSICLLILNGTTYCTGTFVNNTACDGRPLLLTAAHCLENNPSLAGRTVVFMNYLSPRCMHQIRGSEEFSLSGCQALAFSEETDYLLMELKEEIPPDYRLYLAGWSRDTLARHESPFACIHHPYGEGKRYAQTTDSLTYATWPYPGDGFDPYSHWSVRQWQEGHTWTGSSGAPLLNKHHQLIGFLTGGDSGGSSGCGPYQLGDFFVRFQKAWDYESDSLNQLAHWLDPLSSDALTISGLDPNQLNPARRITNLRPTDSIAGLRHENPGNGFLFGHNSFEYKIFAEEFRQDSNSMLKGVYLVPSKGVKSSSSPVYIDVMKGGFVPEETLVSVELNPYYLEYRNRNFHETSKVHFANAENYVCFDPPLSVGKHFYVAIRLVYPSKTVAAIDSFALYSAYHKERTAKNTVWVNNGTDWEFFTAMNRRAHSSSLWLEPVVMKDTLPVVEPPLVVDTLSQRIPLYYSLQDRLLHISFPTGWRSPFEIRIFDPAGRLMHFTSTEQETMTLYIPESFKGFYIIQLTERRRRYVQKIVF